MRETCLNGYAVRTISYFQPRGNAPVNIAALLILAHKPLILPSLLSAEPVIALDMDSVPFRISGLYF